MIAYTHTVSTGKPSFRWVKPAASLKPGVPRLALRRPIPRFRWVKPAASLKLAEDIDTSAVPVGFRWVKPAASLKPSGSGRSAVPRFRQFPLGKTGGLIEAQRPPAGASRQREFPLGKTGGLIEAIDGV